MLRPLAGKRGTARPKLRPKLRPNRPGLILEVEMLLTRALYLLSAKV